MKRTVRLLVFLLVLLMMVICFTACGNGHEADRDNNSKSDYGENDDTIGANPEQMLGDFARKYYCSSNEAEFADLFEGGSIPKKMKFGEDYTKISSVFESLFNVKDEKSTYYDAATRITDYVIEKHKEKISVTVETLPEEDDNDEDSEATYTVNVTRPDVDDAFEKFDADFAKKKEAFMNELYEKNNITKQQFEKACKKKKNKEEIDAAIAVLILDKNPGLVNNFFIGVEKNKNTKAEGIELDECEFSGGAEGKEAIALVIEKDCEIKFVNVAK